MCRLLISLAMVLWISAVPAKSWADEETFPALGRPAPKTVPPVESTSPRISPARDKRVLLLIRPECERCADELRRLNAAGGPFDVLRGRGWKIGAGPENHIQILDATVLADAGVAPIMDELQPKNFPVVLCIEQGTIARSFQRGCTTPLDEWTFGWLMTGNDDRPAEPPPEPIQVQTTGNYRLRGNHWSVEGNWNPTHAEVVHHLRTVHGAQLQTGWVIESWSLEELRSLHDDLHDREEGFRGRYAGNAAPRSPSGSGSVFRKPGNAGR